MRIRLVGHTFGDLKVLRFVDCINGRSFYECLCICGTIVVKKGKYLSNGDTKSCGCRQAKASAEVGRNTATHGLSKHPLFRVWDSIKDRCLNPRCHAYRHYGGRGITICDEWENNFKKFYDDMIEGYSKGLELDRRENDLGYSKDNCRWVTPLVNKRNRRNSVYITVNGVRKHLGEWVSETGINRSVIWARVKSGKVGAEAIYGRKIITNG